MQIERVENGYVLTYGVTHSKRVCNNILEVFKWMLVHFEGKAESFGGDKYARIEIHDKREDV